MIHSILQIFFLLYLWISLSQMLDITLFIFMINDKYEGQLSILDKYDEIVVPESIGLFLV